MKDLDKLLWNLSKNMPQIYGRMRESKNKKCTRDINENVLWTDVY